MKNNMKKILKRFKNERGLTLVELLAVIVILGIIGTIAFVMIGNVTENSKKDAHIANAQQLISAAKLYVTTENPEGNTISAEDLHSSGYIDELIDPWTKSEYDESAATVTVTEGEENNVFTYEVTLNGEKCNIAASESEIKKGDREELCSD